LDLRRPLKTGLGKDFLLENLLVGWKNGGTIPPYKIFSKFSQNPKVSVGCTKIFTHQPELISHRLGENFGPRIQVKVPLGQTG